MATQPNYYYNSPWIADAARNLASALAPPDPSRMLERQKLEFELQNARTTATNTATDRANSERSRAAIGKMYELQKTPVLNAEGKRDVAATEQKAFEYANEAMQYGPKDVRAEVDDALFLLSPSYVKKRLLQKATADAASDRLSRSLAGAIEQIHARGGVQAGLQNDRQAHELERLGKQMDLQLRNWNARAANAAKAANQKPITITKAIGEEIMKGILAREEATGEALTDEERFAMLSDISQATQSSRDPYTATQQIWKKRFPQSRFDEAPTKEVSEPSTLINDMIRGVFQYDPTDPYLAPTPDGTRGVPPAIAAPPAEEPRTLGGAATATPNANIQAFGDRERAMEAEVLARDRAALDTPPPPAAKPSPKRSSVPTKTIKGETRPAPRSRAERDSLPPGTPYWGPNGEDLKVKGR